MTLLHSYLLLFLRGLCTDASTATSKFSFGISTCEEGAAVSGSDDIVCRGPVLLEMLKKLDTLVAPVRSLLMLALEQAAPCAAGDRVEEAIVLVVVVVVL